MFVNMGLEDQIMAIEVSSEFWNDNYSMISEKPAVTRKRIARLMNQPMMRKDRELIVTLLGAAAGDTAAASLARVAHSQTELGGLRTIETVSLVNRATTSGDIADLTAGYLAYSSRPSSYPVDKATLL